MRRWSLLPLSIWVMGLVIVVQVVHGTSSAPTGAPSSEPSASATNKILLLLDVDNTLYCESDLPEPGVERQIVQGIHEYCGRLPSSVDADALHHEYGSTIAGLRATIWKDATLSILERHLQEFYRDVYDAIDVSPLLLQFQDGHPSSTTGYSHSTSVQQQLLSNRIRRLVSEDTTDLQLALASNSPVHHVSKVLQALGWCRVPWISVTTPDSGRVEPNPAVAEWNLYPTKPSVTFFNDVLSTARAPPGSQAVLLDDSKRVLSGIISLAETDPGLFRGMDIQGIHISSQQSLLEALCRVQGWILPTHHGNVNPETNQTYVFSAIEYLRAKRAVDFNSIHVETYRRVREEVLSLLRQDVERRVGREKDENTPPIVLRVVDVGAGLLSMLRLFLHGHTLDEDDGEKMSGDADSKEDSIQFRLPFRLPSLFQSLPSHTSLVEYDAYESNTDLTQACRHELEEMGFTAAPASTDAAMDGQSSVHIFCREAGDGLPRILVRLRMHAYDDQSLSKAAEVSSDGAFPHLIVGCCFADLKDPYDLVKSLLTCFLCRSPRSIDTKVARHETLVYFPITFAGTTQFLPPQPTQELPSERTIPSDTEAFRLYSRALSQQHGHNLNPRLLEEAMIDHGAACLACGRSDWIIPATERYEYLWETMIYFFGTVAAPELQLERWNARGWIERARRKRPTVQAVNVDLLFRIPSIGQWRVKATKGTSNIGPAVPSSYHEIQFAGPCQVTTVEKSGTAVLEPNQVRIRSICSLISSGTELKIFTGSFDNGAALDVNIEGMAEERMEYPLTYGYSLVGTVVECGSGVTDAEGLLGKPVFCFSPHSSQVVADRAAIQVVPDGIDPLDAIFLPSVETAVSLVHDAHPRLGEHVAVFGQGLIGLLVTALLSRLRVDVTAFDARPDRLAASAFVGARQALLPPQAAAVAPLDVSIEVSSNARALQSAIDHTRNGGRVVIGSWYGNTDITLTLGIDFHRSHKTIITSQVSDIPSSLTATWTKERRFALSWDLVREIRPSSLITRSTSLDKAQDAYESLRQGKEIAVVFEYGGDSKGMS